MLNVVCKTCGRKYIYTMLDRKGHGKVECNSCLVNKYRKDKKIKAINYKGGKCQRCGYNKCARALAFHHRNPELKEFGIGEFMNRSWSSIQEELDKCDLLCHNCHAEVEDNILKSKTCPGQDALDKRA